MEIYFLIPIVIGIISFVNIILLLINNMVERSEEKRMEEIIKNIREKIKEDGNDI